LQNTLQKEKLFRTLGVLGVFRPCKSQNVQYMREMKFRIAMAKAAISKKKKKKKKKKKMKTYFTSKMDLNLRKKLAK